MAGVLDNPDPNEAPRPRPTLPALFGVFGKISLLSFGGGIAALIRREFVVTRRWVSEADFHAGYAISQAMPGNNVTNLSIWLGYSLRGSVGAVVACLGTWVPAGLLIVALGSALLRFSQTGTGAIILAGIAASAIGLSLNVGLRTSRLALRNLTCVLVFGAVLLAGALHQSVLLILGVLAPISIALSYWQDRHER